MNIKTLLASALKRDEAKEHKILSETEGTDQFFAAMNYVIEQDRLYMNVEDQLWRGEVLRKCDFDPYEPGPYGDKHEEILTQVIPDLPDNQIKETEHELAPF